MTNGLSSAPMAAIFKVAIVAKLSTDMIVMNKLKLGITLVLLKICVVAKLVKAQNPPKSQTDAKAYVTCARTTVNVYLDVVCQMQCGAIIEAIVNCTA